MTYIQRLVLQGFKSFNKKIAIPFSQTFSVVCGPNGSGKSNLNDAVCFVLGRTSAKSMRADRLHELIFHGGQSKAPAELASVGLYLDNTNKEFPIEETTLHIERRVNKTGVSVYRINGKIVTRQEILDVLSAARIFPDGYNIILQGDITNIIEMDPVERRIIIDEVSGIKEYDEKKEKSQREFEKVEQKLKEVGLIIRERDEAFKKLKEEREVALKYISLNKELKKLRASIAHKRFSSSQTIFQSLTSEIETKEKQVADFSASLDSLDAEIEKKEKELEQLLKFVFERSKKVQIVREVEELRAKILRTRDKIEYDIRERNRLEMLVAKLESVGESQISRPVAEIAKLSNPNVFGTIISLCKVEDKYQTAVEACGGNHLNDMVVKDVRTAETCINHLKENKIGRATFLPLDKMAESLKLPSLTHSDLSKSIGWASDLIDYDKRYDAAFKFVFGSTLVFDKIENARHLIGKVRIVTLDGDLIERSGAMIGGYFRRKKAFEFSEMDEYKSAIKALENEISTLKKQIDEYDKELEKKVEQERREALDIVDSEKARSRLMKEVEDSKRKRKKAYEDRLEVQSHINKFKLQRARTEAEVENSSQDFEQYKEETDFLDLPVEDMESRTKVVIRETESLGAVNMKSIEEFEKFGEEFETLRTKYQKIIEERDAVLNMINEIEGRKKETFMKTFEEISKNFKEIFREAAHGDAELMLEIPDDIYSGLEIRASPSGKRILNIDMMSGGERSLTALAFLFALQQYKPAPFYILDEVDAALDKANSKKVGEMIRKFSSRAQFIVITHNDTTIKMGDQVYGVSMEDGESKIIAIEMPKYNPAEGSL